MTIEVSRASLEALGARLDEVEGYLHIDERRAEVSRLEEQSARPDFWNDAEAASATMAQLTRAREDVQAIDGARAKLDDAFAALELGEEMEEDELLEEADQLARELTADLGELELSSWFTGEFDHGDAIAQHGFAKTFDFNGVLDSSEGRDGRRLLHSAEGVTPLDGRA